MISSWPWPLLISLLLEEDRCKLYCKAENFEFFFAMSSKVKDGTPCSSHKNDVCIDGICEVREHFCFGVYGHACVASYQMHSVRSVPRDSCVWIKAGGVGEEGDIFKLDVSFISKFPLSFCVTPVQCFEFPFHSFCIWRWWYILLYTVVVKVQLECKS